MRKNLQKLKSSTKKNLNNKASGDVDVFVGSAEASPPLDFSAKTLMSSFTDKASLD